MRQVGWYDPQSCTFFNGDKDDGCHGAYSEPVFVDDEGDEIPTSPCKESGSDDEQDPQVLLQILRNQHFVMGQLDEIRQRQRAHSYETGPVHRDTTMYDALRKKTRDLLEKEGYEP